MKKIILLIWLFLLIGCDTSSNDSNNIIYLPNKSITFNDQMVYYNKTLFSGTLIGYDIESNSECPDEITVDFIQGIIQGRAQAITLENIDVLYQINEGKLEGWTSVLFSRILYRDDKAIECSISKIAITEFGYNDNCSVILKQDVSSPDSILTIGKSVTNAFYQLLNDINNNSYQRHQIPTYCAEVYTEGLKALNE